MSFGNIPWLSAVMMGALLIVPASAADKIEVTPLAAALAPAPYKRTFMFPPTGIANLTEAVRISVLNIAPNGQKKASCHAVVVLKNSDGTMQLLQQEFKAIPSGQVAIADFNPQQNAIPGIPAQNIRIEVQGSVELIIDPTNWAPCSLLLTLEVYDAPGSVTPYVTRALVTAAIEEPIAVGEPGFGRGH